MSSAELALASALVVALLGCAERRAPAPAPPDAAPHANDDRAEERAAMVDELPIDDVRVAAALRRVPREWFVPPDLQDAAYEDRALPIGEGQTISQPTVVATMTQALGLAPDDKVLEVGTGSGYQAAVLSELTPHVFTIEIVAELATRARAAFDAHGYDTIRTRVGDGWRGWPEEAPFDAIIVTAAPERIPPALLEQLRVGGRMCLPLGPQGAVQRLLLITRTGPETYEERDLFPVRFVPMTGGADADADAGER